MSWAIRYDKCQFGTKSKIGTYTDCETVSSTIIVDDVILPGEELKVVTVDWWDEKIRLTKSDRNVKKKDGRAERAWRDIVSFLHLT